MVRNLLILALIPLSLGASDSVVHIQYSYLKPDGWTAFGHGSGVLVDLTDFGITDKNIVLTAAHVIEDAKNNYVELEGQKVIVKLLYLDKFYDLALVQLVTDKPLNAVKLSSKNYVAKNDTLTYEGFPRGKHDLQQGSVIGLHANSYQWVANCKGFFHGWSGGGVFDKEGLVGICIAMDYDQNLLINHVNTTGEVPDKVVFLSIDRIKQFILFYKYALKNG